MQKPVKTSNSNLEETKDDSIDQPLENSVQSDDSELPSVLMNLSPQSKKQLTNDIEAHGGVTNFKMSFDFFANTLSQKELTSVFTDKKIVAYRAVIDKMQANGDRTKILDWLL